MDHLLGASSSTDAPNPTCPQLERICPEEWQKIYWSRFVKCVCGKPRKTRGWSFNEVTQAMVKIRTLNELPQLRDSEFNQPFPREGMNLLYWFSQNYKDLNPTTGEYGFHPFHNRIDDDEDRLLPDQNLRYYEVGNLNDPGADKLPTYVRPPKSLNYYGVMNKDRIIVRVNQRRIDRVYVTEHADQKNFSHDKTYRVTQGLLEQISKMEKSPFLNFMQSQRINLQSQQYQQNQQESESSWSWCTIL